jgi:hypothetical protein
MRASSSNPRGPGGPEGRGWHRGRTPPSIHGSIVDFSPIRPELTIYHRFLRHKPVDVPVTAWRE